MKKLLFILPSYHAGGAENSLLRFLPFISNNCEVHVMAPGGGGTELLPAFQSAGCTTVVDSIGLMGWSNSRRFVRLLQAQKFDAVCTLTGTFGGWALFLAWLGGVPARVGWHLRSSDAFRPSLFRNAYNSFVKWLLERSATRILSNSAVALDFFHGKSWRKDARYSVIQNGVPFQAINSRLTQKEAKQRLGFSEQDFIVGHIGRLDPAKNHKVILEVAAMMRDTHPQIRFLFCGKDTDGDAFRQLLAQHKVEGNCTGIGLHNGVGDVYRAMDLFFFPSVTEGQPNALLEAAGAGLPLVASGIEAIKEATPESFHNKLTPPQNAKAFAGLIDQLYQNETAREAYRLTKYVLNRYDLERNMIDFKNALPC